jgi:drug/metabolite transporter (DMT)-like permease
MIAPAPDRPLAGIVTRLMAAAMLAVMFALVKLAALRGVTLIESLFYRQLLALPLVVATVAAGPGLASLRTRRLGMHATRMAIGLVAMGFNFLGMILLPLAEATVIGFAVPLFATLFAALILREPVGPWRWSAVAIGFVGVLIVLHPDGRMMHSSGALVALTGALATATVSVFIRQLGQTEPSGTIVFWFTLLSLLPLGLLMPFYAQAHDGQTWLLLLGIGISGGISQLLLTNSLRLAPVSVVLPMDYSGLLWSTLTGWLIFSVLPVPETLIGAPIIIASGLVILWREKQRGTLRRDEAVSDAGAA